ncbi:MAG: hypothetical protein GYB33_08735 [Gammaproteobacteria bacterium]|nr:hypothetical protein [Gammaproteobacteria bacterium]
MANRDAEVAEGQGVQPGDQLRFSVGGLELNAEVASVRSVQWDSMNPNFYFLCSPGMDKRLQEVALLRAMGSSRLRLRGSVQAEFSLLVGEW